MLFEGEWITNLTFHVVQFNQFWFYYMYHSCSSSLHPFPYICMGYVVDQITQTSLDLSKKVRLLVTITKGEKRAL